MTGGLELRGLDVAFGLRPAVRTLDLAVAAGESVALVGANGAGKTTTLLALAGALKSGARIVGTQHFAGRAFPWGDVRGRLAAGISLVPEREKVFTLLTVRENLRIGASRARGDRVRLDDVLSWFPRLGERRETLAGNLSGGEQQMLALGVSLLGTPRLILLDEPTLGLAVPVIEDFCASLRRLKAELGLGALVAESDSNWLPHLADRAVVIDRGRRVADFARLEPPDLDAIHDVMLGLTNSGEVGHG
ncbi:ATP-binding cassette domain-containing protein [Xanthobacter sp. V4C-4]|uniref:ABC transporter ATP-binding protein n=1 Tax=Xanthobacter cornucopiae TaxID=3119924 RepID=UPI00372B2894